MPLPPEAIYISKQELRTASQSLAAHYGYAFGIKRSKNIGSGSRIKIIYSYDRYGPPPLLAQQRNSLQNYKRQINIRKIGLIFSLVGIEQAVSQ